MSHYYSKFEYDITHFLGTAQFLARNPPRPINDTTYSSIILPCNNSKQLWCLLRRTQLKNICYKLKHIIITFQNGRLFMRRYSERSYMKGTQKVSQSYSKSKRTSTHFLMSKNIVLNWVKVAQFMSYYLRACIPSCLPSRSTPAILRGRDMRREWGKRTRKVTHWKILQ